MSFMDGLIGLNLPAYSFRIKSKENKLFIFDVIRKKNVVLTPEEWVRQHIVHFLITEKSYPQSLIAIEKKLVLHGLSKRADILVFNRNGLPELIVECKSPHISISQESFDQIARYNMKLNAKYLFVTNGLAHYYCQIDHLNERYTYLETLPPYQK
jgi:hypothetical protein